MTNNIPGLDNGAGGGTSRREQRSSSREESVFEIGNTRSERIREPGDIRRLSVAVVVNGLWDEDGQYAERSEEDIARLVALVNSAAGIDQERGDTVTVESLRFASGDPNALTGDGSGLIDLLAMNFGTIVRAFSAISVVALLLLLGVRR